VTLYCGGLLIKPLSGYHPERIARRAERFELLDFAVLNGVDTLPFQQLGCLLCLEGLRQAYGRVLTKAIRTTFASDQVFKNQRFEPDRLTTK